MGCSGNSGKLKTQSENDSKITQQELIDNWMESYLLNIVTAKLRTTISINLNKLKNIFSSQDLYKLDNPKIKGGRHGPKDESLNIRYYNGNSNHFYYGMFIRELWNI